MKTYSEELQKLIDDGWRHRYKWSHHIIAYLRHPRAEVVGVCHCGWVGKRRGRGLTVRMRAILESRRHQKRENRLLQAATKRKKSVR